MSKHPEVLWAQRSSDIAPEKNVIYLTVNLPNIVEKSLQYDLTPTSLSFKATASVGAEESQYAFDLALFAEVEPEKSTRRLTSRDFLVVLRKKETKTEYWPRLTKEKLKTPFIRTDFGKWVDEDEQDGKPGPEEDFDFGGGVGGLPGMDSDLDFSKMSSDFGAGALPKETGGVDIDSDEEDDDGGPPPLEDPELAK